MSLNREEPNYFGAGPAQLPTNVLQQAAKDLINFNEIGIGIGEISHRSKEANEIIENAKSSLKELMKIPDTHEVFFMQGGGTTGFSSIASNLIAAYVGRTGEVAPAGYLITGSWSKKSFEEAKRLYVPVEAIFDARDFNNGKYGTIPVESEWQDKIKSKKFSYIYLCENETVHGVEWPQLPKCLTEDPNIELVADLSSDILSREVDVSQYGVIMAGAQKNIGLAGLTVYIVKKEIMKNIAETSEARLHELGLPITPIAFHYPTVVKNNSAYNTIPIFTLRIMELVFQHLLESGGVAAQSVKNKKKAKLLYDALEANSSFYTLPVNPSCRSKMNVVFTLKKEKLNEKFLQEAEELHLTGLKGHRSVGGIRASIYNAVSVKSTEKLANFIKSFAQQNSR